jgi:hypothetical protein
MKFAFWLNALQTVAVGAIGITAGLHDHWGIAIGAMVLVVFGPGWTLKEK